MEEESLIPFANDAQGSSFVDELKKMEDDVSHHNSKRPCTDKSEEIPAKAKQGSPLVGRSDKGEFGAPSPVDEADARHRSETGRTGVLAAWDLL